MASIGISRDQSNPKGDLPSTIVRHTLNLVLVAAVCMVILLEFRNPDAAYVPIALALPIFGLNRFAFDRTPGRSFKLTPIDWAVAIVLLIEVLTYWRSSYRSNSLGYISQVAVLFGLYCLWNWGIDRDYQRVAVYCFIAALAFWVSSRTLYSFYLHYCRLSALGFREMTSFRHLFFMVGADGYATGERVSVLLLLLPYPLILAVRLARRRWLAALLLLPVATTFAALSVTFLRGIYAGAATFGLVAGLLAWKYSVVSKKTLLGAGLVLTILIGLALLPVRRSVATTLSIATTESQVSSIEGRAGLWRGSWKIFRRHPMLGSGALNFPMEYSYFPENRPDFVIGAFNIFIQVAVEKGILGLAAYVGLFVLFFVTAKRRLNERDCAGYTRAVAVFTIAAIGAILVRDLTYSSLLLNPACLVLFWLVLADLSQAERASLSSTGWRADGRSEIEPEPRPRLQTRTLRPGYLVLMLVIIAAIGLSAEKGSKQREAQQAFASFVDLMGNRQFQHAEDQVNRVLMLSPDSAYYRSSLAVAQERAAEGTVGGWGALQDPSGNAARVETAMATLEKAISLNPYDDCFVHNLGWLYWFAGRRAEAVECFKRAIALDGSVPQYRVSLGMASEALGSVGQAKAAYIEALRISPALVSSEFFADFKKRSPEMARESVEAAIESLDREVSQGSDAVTLAKLGRLRLESDPRMARTELRRAATARPDLSRLWSNLGALDELNGDFAAAKLDYERAVFLDGSDFVPLLGLAKRYESEDEFRRAVDCYSLALAKWRAMVSFHAYRSTRIYRSDIVLPNDIVPSWLMHYTEPALDWKEACLKLSELYLQIGDGARAQEYESLSKTVER